MWQLLKYMLLLLLPHLLFANFVQWMGAYDSAHQRALKEKKALLVLLVKKNDPLSSEIIQKTFMDQYYVKKINQTMIPVIVTYEGFSSYPIEMYYSTRFPTLFFVDSSRELFLHSPLYGREITVEKMVEIFK